MSAAQEQVRHLIEVADVIIQLVTAHGPDGMPAGHLYCELMAHGCTLATFETLMSVLVRAGRLTHRGHVYFAA